MIGNSSLRRSGTAFLFAVSIAVSVVGTTVVIAAAVPGSGGDVGDTRSNATMIDGEEDRIKERIAASDVDWYAVELKKGQSLSVRLAIFGHRGNRGNTPRVGLYGPDGTRIAVHTTRGSQTPVAGDGTQTSLDHTIGQPGTYYVKVTTDSKMVRKRPYTLTVTVESPDSDSPPANNNSTPAPGDNDSAQSPDSQQAVPIEPGKTISGSIAEGNREYFSIKTDAGDVLSIETTFDSPAKSSGTVYVYGPDGKRIRTGSDIRQITAENGGIYTIVLVSGESSKLTYTLTATLSSKRSSATSRVRHIKTSQTIKGTIRSNDEIDWYAVEIEKGQGFVVTLEHTNRKDPSVEISFDVYNPNRKRIGEAPFARPVRAYQTGPAAASAYGGDVAKRSGTYYIGVRGVKGADYSLTVETVKLDAHDPNEQPAAATPISVGTSVSGVLTGYDRDVYAVDLQKGESVTIEYNSTGAIQPSLWVAGPRVRRASKPIGDYSFGEYTIAGSGTDDSLTFTANRTGTYYIKMVPYFERSTAATFFERTKYELTIQKSGGAKRILSVNRVRTPTTPSTETVKLNTSVRTVTPTPTPTPTTTATATPPPTTQTTTTATANENDETPPPTTSTNGPGFGVLLTLVGLGGGTWWYQRQQ